MAGRFIASVVLQCFFFASGARTDEWRELRVAVRDWMGRPVASARVAIQGGQELQADGDGTVRIENSPAIRFPILLQVGAPGHADRLHVIESPDRGASEVCLAPLSGEAPAGVASVTAAELRADSRRTALELHNRALEAIRRSDYGSAERLLRRAAELAPSAASIQNNLGVVCLRQGDLDRAAGHFAAAARLAPRDPGTIAHLGLVRWAERRYLESIELLTEAERLGYESAAVRYLLGLAALQTGRADQAVRYLKRVPEDRFRHRDLFLSVAAGATGKRAEAVRLFRRYIAQHPVPLGNTPVRYVRVTRDGEVRYIHVTHAGRE